MNGRPRATSVETLGSADDATQRRVLVELMTQGVNTMTSLAAALRVPETRIMLACIHLVERGLVIHVPRAATDREGVVALSTAGARVAADLVERSQPCASSSGRPRRGVTWRTRCT